MKQIQIKKIDLYTTDKNGNPLQGKFGPVTKIRVTDEQGLQYWGYGNKTTFDWQVGMTVKINVETNTFNGKTYNNFKPLSEIQELEERFNVRLQRLENRVFSEPDSKLPSLSDEKTPAEDIPDELPF